jgi:hypothetical protein
MRATAQDGDPLHLMQADGFTLTLEDGGLALVPASKLTAEQRTFIASHKPALVAALTARATTTEREPLTAVEAVEALQQAGYAVSVKGDRLVVEPADRLTEAQRGTIERLGWAMVQLLSFGTLETSELNNEVQADPAYVCCFDCRHSVLPANTEPRYGWRRCGLELPDGDGFGQVLRRCERWEKQP